MMRATKACLLVLCVVLTAGGCAKPIPTGPLMDPLSAGELGFTPQWAANLEVPPGMHLSHVVVLGDLVVTVESPSNIVTALSVRAGKEVWRRQVDESAVVLNKPFRIGDRLYINSPSQLYVLDVENGHELARHGLESSVNRAPAVFKDRVVYGAMNGLVFAQDLETGATLWRARLPGRIVASPVAVGTSVLVADQQGEYALMDSANGSVRWMGRTFGPITATPAAGKQNIFIASEDQSLYAIAKRDGSEQWKYAAGQRLTKSPVKMSSIVMLPLPRGGTVVFDALRGTELWRNSLSMEPVVASKGRVLVLAGRTLSFVERSTGARIVSAAVQPLQTVLSTGDGGIVLVSPRGRLLKLDRR